MQRRRSDGALLEEGQPDPDGSAQHITTNYAGDLTQLPLLHFSFNWIYLFLYLVFLVILNVLVPCLIFYLLQNGVFYSAGSVCMESVPTIIPSLRNND